MAARKLVYDVGDKPKFKNLLLYSFQLLLAILAATVAVPTIIGLPSQIPSAILGAGVGTIVYILFTKGKSPIVVSSSFAYLAAFPAAIAFGYCGILLGGLLSGLMYVIIAIIVKFAGTHWVNKLMPAVIIGPVVALIGLSLAPNAVGDLMAANSSDPFHQYNWVAIFCGLATLFTVVICTVQNKRKGIKLIPFIIGIGVGYTLATIFTLIGNATHNTYLQIIDWSPLTSKFQTISWKSFFDYPHISFAEAIKEMIHGGPSKEYIIEIAQSLFSSNKEAFEAQKIMSIADINLTNFTAVKNALETIHQLPVAITGAGVATIAIAFCPIALVAFAEHIADHKNMSTIIGHDLINDEPGLHRTLLGDGVGSMAGAAFGICPNTSYGEGIACVALTKNASVLTTLTTAVICIVLSFLVPFSTVLQTIPKCVMGGVCLALYGYISVSGLKMFKEVDLDDNVNLLTVCVILIAGIGGLSLKIPYALGMIPDECKYLIIGNIATALILGILVYNVARKVQGKEKVKVSAVNKDVANEDLVRIYLKRFNVDKLAEGMLIFGFLHENIDFSVAQLSNYLRSNEMLNNRTPDELKRLIELFELEGYKKGMKKDAIIKLIKKDCVDIEKKATFKVTGSAIR